MSKSSNNKVKHINLSTIENPKFLSGLSFKELNVLSQDIRAEILRVTSIYGGHLSSNLGTVELTIALNRVFDFSTDKLIFDVGHQCYTYKILTGRSLEGLRTEGGISGFQKRKESLYDCYEAGHSSTSISAANGFAVARDLKNEKYNVIAFIGDASIVSGLAFEGLNNIASSNHKVIIILNDNGMSISKPAGGVGKMFARISSAAGYNRMKVAYRKVMFKTKFGKSIYNTSVRFKNWFKRKVVPQTIFDSMGLSYIGPVDGHNIKALEKEFKRAKNTTKSVVVHCCTLKGKGYKPAEKDITGYWHGVTPFKIETGDPKKLHPGYNSWSHIFGDLTLKMMEKHKNAYLISPATMKGASMDDAFTKYAERASDVGIAEEHAVTLASGLSINGFHPIVSIYSTFMQRAYDQISHDLARMNCNATFLVDRAGLVGADGETHQGIYDVAFLYSIPNVVITMPSNIDEANYLYEESFNNHGPFFIRIPRCVTKHEDTIHDLSCEYGRWIKIKESRNKKLVIVGVGPLLRELAKLIEENNIDCAIYNAIYIKPLDENAIDELLDYERIVIYDAYSTPEGFINALMSKLSQKQFKGLISPFYVKNEFVAQASVDRQLERFGLRPEQVIESIK